MMTPLYHASGTVASTQQAFSKRVSSLAMSWPPYLTISGAISSNPVTLPFLSACIAVVVSDMVISPTSICKSSTGVSSSSGKVVGRSGWLNISLKCSTYRLSCSTLVSRGLRFLSLMGPPWPVLDPVSLRTILSLFRSVWRLLALHCLTSRSTLSCCGGNFLLTWRSRSRYAASAVTRMSSEDAWSRTALASCCSSMIMHVRPWIHRSLYDAQMYITKRKDLSPLHHSFNNDISPPSEHLDIKHLFVIMT